MELAARQLLRALRGHRSQVAFSRRLGYRGNVVAKWEGGHRFPTFGEMMRAAERVGIDVADALHRFDPSSADVFDRDAIGPWLQALQGKMSQVEVAKRTGLSRQQVGRVLSGRARGRLPEVMALVDALTGRLPEFVAHLVPIEQVEALAVEATMRDTLARLAVSHPWSIAAQAWLDAEKKVPLKEAPARLAAALLLPLQDATALVDVLVRTSAAVVKGHHLVPAPPTTVELKASREEIAMIRSHWATVSSERVGTGLPEDLFSFNVFALSREDLIRVREAQRAFYREVRSIVADSPPEVAAMLVVHTAVFSDENGMTGR